MKKLLPLAFAAAVSLTPAAAIPPPPLPDPAATLRDQALQDDLAWNLMEGLTTEIGPRLAGTEAEARARDWAVARLTALGFSNVRIETFDLPVWERGEERGEIIAPFPQPLVLATLGNSAATPRGGLEAQVVRFASLADLEAAPDAIVQGRIVFIDHDMSRTQDGSSYGQYGQARFRGPAVASAKGAVGAVIRSIGTDSHRNPHVGGTNWPEGVRPIPAAALANPDADQLARIFTRGQPVRLRLTLTPRTRRGQSGNVVAEVPGSDPSAGVILIGGHLDSWDLATGAFDNAGGVAITTAAAHRIMQSGQPRRTIRLVLFGAEETGVHGGRAYFERHNAGSDVVLVAESDFGPDRVWRAQFNFAPANAALADRVAALLAPLGVVRGRQPAGGGADLGPWARAGFAAIDLNPDGTRYFDFHHTPDDTLEKVDPAQLRQSVAAWTAMLAAVANAPETIERPGTGR